VDEANAKIAERHRAAEAALDAEDAARERACEAAEYQAERDRFLRMLDGNAPKALGDGTRATNPDVGTTDTTALVPLGDGTTTALALLSNPADAVVEERRRRRAAYESACTARHAARKAFDEAGAALAKNDHHQALLRQACALRQQRKSIEERLRTTDTDPEIGTFRILSPDVEADPEYGRLAIALQSTRAQLQPAEERLRALHDEEEAALRAMRTAQEDYFRWLAVERERRLYRLLDETPRLTRACRHCGHATSFAVGKEFCSDDCKTKYRRFDGEWFPQCSTCQRFFIADVEGGGIFPTRNLEAYDGVTFCSPRCLLASDADLDDWPEPDAECWGKVIEGERPPLTAAKRFAEVRKSIIVRFQNRLRHVGEAPGFSIAAGPLPIASATPDKTSTALVIPSAAPAVRETPTEALILAALARGEARLDDLVIHTGKPRSTVHRALRKLEKAGGINRRRAGTRNDPYIYFISSLVG
jgi:DNA-binding transcriptional ArsR family regulator